MSSQRFAGKVAVVTGGNNGMGLAVAKAYAREGAQVAITGRDEASLKTAAAEIGAGTLAIRSDAARIADTEAAIAQIKAKFGRIDALFINAGIGKFVPIEQVTEAAFDETMNVNLKGLYFTIQKALPLLSRGSSILLNASINGHIGMINTSVYGASKAAVINLGKTLATELVDRGIRVNVISPGPIETTILNRMGLPDAQLKQTKDWIQSQVPMKRFGTGEEIAAAVLYLTSPEASFVTGSELIMDGGMTL